MTLAAGSKLGPYEILAPIGAGGMGEVYRAKDPRLGREVAIKVLPASFSADLDRLRRFEQEAKAAGVLNHPNITAVYDIGQHEGAPYVVQELLEGETLRSVLAGGRLSPRKAIDHALQIAHGLAAAHEKGIVHRDLKPENLFVTHDGRVKILDFGLAKLTHQEEGSQATNLPTATAGTEPGMVLGTLGYMSPEQVRGRPADARSDIFSFGAILYEMLSGKRAFHGDSAADTMSAILKEDPPDLSVTNQNISSGLERIVRHCLEKTPGQRFHSAHDLAFDLEALSGTSGQSVAGAIGARHSKRPPLLALGVAAAVLAAFAAGHFLWTPAAPSSPTFKRLTFRRGNLGIARFASDGKSVIYGASWEGKPIEIFSTRPEGPESMPLGFANADLFGVSPSGELALSRRDRYLSGGAGTGTLARAPLGGGVPRDVLEFVEFADWAPSGKDLAITRFLEGKYRLEYPIGKVLYASSNHLSGPRFSPSGDAIAFFERGTSIMVTDLSGKAQKLAGPGLRSARLAWAPSGDEIWFDDLSGSGEGQIRGVTRSGRLRVLARGPDHFFMHDVARDGRALVERAASRRSVVCLPPGETKERDLSWFDASHPIGLSPDGRTVLFGESGDAGGSTRAFYLRKTDGSPAVKLGEGEAADLSPDGKWVLIRRDDRKSLALVPTGTGSGVSIPMAGFERIDEAAFFPDNTRILVVANEPGKNQRIFTQALPSGKPKPISGEGFDVTGRPLSADGLWVVAFRDWEEDLFLFPTGGGSSRTIPDSKRLDPVGWSPDGKSVFAVETGSIPARVVRVDVATGRRELWKELGPPDLSGLVSIGVVLMTPDAKAYVYGYSRAVTSDLYLVEGLK